MNKWIKNDKVYIIPSSRGMTYIALDFILLLIGLTYNNNVILGVSFLMFCLFISSMFESHFYLNAIKIVGVNLEEGFLDEAIKFQVFTNSSKKEISSFYGKIIVKIKDQPSIKINKKMEIGTQNFFLNLQKMGKNEIEWIELINYSPNSLFRTWKYQKISFPFLIYPRRAAYPLEFKFSEGSLVSFHQGDSVFFDPYNELMAQKSIHWKKSLMMGQLFVKNLQSGNEKTLSISLDKIDIHQAAYALDQAQKNQYPVEFIHKNVVLPFNIKQALQYISHD